MKRYIINRLLLLIPTILGVTFIIFTIMSLTPGDPGRIILGQGAEQADVDQFNRDLGLDRPFLVRYVTYVANAVRGDFGLSYRTGRPVYESIRNRFPFTVTLAFLGVLGSMIIGIPLGILSAVKQYSFWDILGSVSAMFLAAVPGFWLGLMLILFFSLRLGWLPSSGVGTYQHYIMPAITLAIPGAARILRLTRTTMLETIRTDYVRTARAKGAKERTVVWKHALRNALLPIVTSIGVSFAAALGGTVITEAVFALPGLGTLVITSIRMKDTPQVMAAVLLLSFLFMIIILLIDLTYGFIDPRIKSMYR